MQRMGNAEGTDSNPPSEPTTSEPSSLLLSRDEASTAATTKAVRESQTLRNLFDRFGGSSGHLEVHKLQPLFEELLKAGGVDSYTTPEGMLKEIVSRVNIDSRGRVAFEEFRQALVAIELGKSTSFAEIPKDAGHVFVLLADLRKIACDCWVIPTGPTLIPTDRWMVSESDFGALTPEPIGGARIRMVPGWPAEKPQPFVLNTHPPNRPPPLGSRQPSGLSRGGSVVLSSPSPRSSGASSPLQFPSTSVEKMDLQWVHESLHLFLDAALRFCREKGRTPRNRRAKFLVCLPLLASKLAPQFSGQLIREILPLLYGFALGNGIDIGLATVDRTVFAVMQSERSRWSGMVRNMLWADLSPMLLQEGRRLADYASRDELALFLGAGVSIGAGLPSWAELLARLAKRCMTGDDLLGLNALPFIDQARIIGERMGGNDVLAEAIAKECRSPVFSLSHALLASLPIRNAVTSNYDILFEEASKTCVKKLATLPYEPSTASDRWVLKLHGCINHPQDIVLTREQYLRYDAMRAALGGIVQAMLITKQMLFVGFSLQDENFHRIIDAVRRALSHSDLHGEAFGTSLFLARERFMNVLWKDDLKVVPMTEEGTSVSESARVLEIFLDYLASLSGVGLGEFLLDSKFTNCLDPSARALRDHILQFLHTMPEEAKTDPLHAKLTTLIYKNFGKPTSDFCGH